MTTGLVINIGWARAASTALRENLLARHPGLIAIGASSNNSDIPGARFCAFLKETDDETFERHLPEVRERWLEVRTRTDGLICLTDEELSIGLPGQVRPEAIARRCASLFPEARILAVVREQVSAVGSFYALTQRPVFGNSVAFPEWLNRYFLEPSDGEGFAYLFRYARALAAHATGRSPEDLLVIDYRHLCANTTGTYRHIANWMGIDEAACDQLPVSVVNASPVGGPPWRKEQESALRALYAADCGLLLRDFGIDLAGVRNGLEGPGHVD
jgi:hypothetical protein